jgi:hypothetical protein
VISLCFRDFLTLQDLRPPCDVSHSLHCGFAAQQSHALLGFHNQAAAEPHGERGPLCAPTSKTPADRRCGGSASNYEGRRWDGTVSLGHSARPRLCASSLQAATLGPMCLLCSSVHTIVTGASFVMTSLLWPSQVSRGTMVSRGTRSEATYAEPYPFRRLGAKHRLRWACTRCFSFLVSLHPSKHCVT